MEAQNVIIPRVANHRRISFEHSINMDTLGIEPRASRMLSGCDTTTPCAPWKLPVATLPCASFSYAVVAIDNQERGPAT